MMDNGWQDALIYHIASGQAFFLGTALIIVAIGLSITVTLKRLVVARDLAVFMGMILVAVSATPLPYSLYGMLGGVTVVWLISEWLRSRIKRQVGMARMAIQKRRDPRGRCPAL